MGIQLNFELQQCRGSGNRIMSKQKGKRKVWKKENENENELTEKGKDSF